MLFSHHNALRILVVCNGDLFNFHREFLSLCTENQQKIKINYKPTMIQECDVQGQFQYKIILSFFIIKADEDKCKFI